MKNAAETLNLDFDAEAAGDDAFKVHLSDYQGPLHLLLDMARGQKVDLAKISVLALADQYIAYIETAKSLRLEIAADYLVMAAWLTYLKSRLLLPKQEQPKDEPSAGQMADALAFQLRRLESIQSAATDLFVRPQKGQGFFTRGAPEGFVTRTRRIFNDTLYDLLSAYVDHTRRQEQQGSYTPATPHSLTTMEEAMERIGTMFDLRGLWRSKAWINLQELMDGDAASDLSTISGRSCLTALLSASLEMAKNGQLDLQQPHLFGPIYLRARAPDDAATTTENPEETHHVST
jgi:segregation and condensation protein A